MMFYLFTIGYLYLAVFLVRVLVIGKIYDRAITVFYDQQYYRKYGRVWIRDKINRDYFKDVWLRHHKWTFEQLFPELVEKKVTTSEM